MSSYHSSFTYLNQNTATDKKLRIASFNADNGEHDTFLSMTPITDDYYDGTKKFDYGAKFDSVATIQITLIKPDETYFSVAENRDLLRWLTGVRTNSWLDFYEGDNIKYSFFGRITDVKQQKLDARVIGLVLTFTSIHPWAYSSIQVVECELGSDGFPIEVNGAIYQNESSPMFGIDNSGILYINSNGKSDTFDITDYGVVYKIQDTKIDIKNPSDDLYTYINLDVEYINKSKKESMTNSLTIKNLDLDEETSVVNISQGEVVKLSSGQFIISDKPKKIFGDSFNFIWPRLMPGTNQFSVNGSGAGHVTFRYRYPIKIGDCAVDIENIINNPVLCEEDEWSEEELANMTMRIEDNYLQYSLDGKTWKNAIEISELAIATSKYITTEVDNAGILEIISDDSK